MISNYATSDGLAAVARCGVFLSVLFSYPLVFTSLKDSVLRVLAGRGVPPLSRRATKAATFSLLCGVAALATVRRATLPALSLGPGPSPF